MGPFFQPGLHGSSQRRDTKTSINLQEEQTKTQCSKDIEMTPAVLLFSSIKDRMGQGPNTCLWSGPEVRPSVPRPIISVKSSAGHLFTHQSNVTFKTQSQTDGCILLNWTLMKKSRFFCCREKGIIALKGVHHRGEEIMLHQRIAMGKGALR